ncbi:copper chaperone PCu(A)C [Geodermatophilus sp. YIM 151500]|uniref:copper chaperone PCu(A)C n=1 Tax=Geodermatophilus sp. YIM 151500 TaxID=2984531 RepID=UPI0021E45E3D|nr:copper chaperone PCu(A)C [Geodermatophilus sp. YIM 151500]MCV2489699.1 copper chaperone PCu(A)C [Geodermatophilus sp. YIM 151500]
MNRALRAATMGALLLTPVALGACSAGQVTQTETQERDKVGPMADVNNVTLRQVLLEYPNGGRYEAGDDAALIMAVVNNAPDADVLIGIDGEGFEGIQVDGQDASGQLDIEIPSDSTVFVGGQDGPEIVLTGLGEELTPAQGIPLTFTFEDAGPVDVRAVVSNPTRALSRGEPFDFHGGEEELGEPGLVEGAGEVGGEGGGEGGSEGGGHGG